MTKKPKRKYPDFRAHADSYVRRTLVLAERTVDEETLRRIVTMVRWAYAPPGYGQFCHHPERCAGNSYCIVEEEDGIACNE